MPNAPQTRSILNPSSTAGNAVLEFALVAPLLFLVLFGITEFGRALGVNQALYTAAREGARVAVVTDPDGDLVNARVAEVLAAAGIAPTGVQIVGPVGTANRTVTVTVQTDFTVIPGTILGGFAGTIPLQAAAVMSFEN